MKALMPKYASLDIESIGLKPFAGTIWSIAVKYQGKKYLVHNCNGVTAKDFKSADGKMILKIMQDDSIIKIIHRSLHDVTYVELVLGIKIKNIVDTQQSEILVQGLVLPAHLRTEENLRRHSSALNFMLPRYKFKAHSKKTRENFVDRPLGKPFTKAEIQYMYDDVEHLEQIAMLQLAHARKNDYLLLYELEQKVAECLARMKARGIGFDMKRWLKIADENEKEFKRRMNALPKQVKNWNSPAQVKEYFKTKHKIIIPSFDEIEKIASTTKNKTLLQFIEARELSKAVSSYGRNWLTDGFMDGDGRVRCDVQQIISTGRMSMSEPNLQQLPADGKHRSAFIPKPGYCFIVGDFSGQEMGIMAASAKERIWIEAMLRDDDIHAVTASLLYAGKWDGAGSRKCAFPKNCSCPGHQALRARAKILNFRLAYGGGPQKFADDTGITFNEAKIIVKRYKRIVKYVTYWLDVNGRNALRDGISFSADPYKRRRVLLGQEDWQIINQGKNNPVQAAGANMLKRAFVNMSEELPPVLLIHDEIIAEVPIKAAKKSLKIMKEVMEESAEFITGIKGLVKVTPKAVMSLDKKEKCIINKK